jgi:cell division protein FtsI/penicillin-binding protein 2
MSILDEGFRAPGGTSRNRPHGNLAMLRLAVLGMFLILGIRLGWMQIVDGASYARRSEENHIIQRNVLPTRGLITDRNGEALVQNVGVYSASILPEALPNEDQYDDWKERRYRLYLKLEDLVGVSALEIQTRVEDAEDAGKDYIAIKVADNLTKAQALALEEVSVDMRRARSSATSLGISGHSSRRTRRDWMASGTSSTNRSARTAWNRVTRPTCAVSSGTRRSNRMRSANRSPRCNRRTRCRATA